MKRILNFILPIFTSFKSLRPIGAELMLQKIGAMLAIKGGLSSGNLLDISVISRRVMPLVLNGKSWLRGRGLSPKYPLICAEGVEANNSSEMSSAHGKLLLDFHSIT